MPRNPCSLFLLLFLALASLPACVRQAAPVQESFSNGSLDGVLRHDGPVYLGVRDSTGQLGQLDRLLRQNLTRQGFALTGNPSDAAWIAQVALPAAGPCQAGALRQAVSAGYDSQCRLGWQDKGRASGCIADILLVRRNIPEDKRESRKRLRNVSARNALASSQMRLGLVLTGKKAAEHLPAALAERLTMVLTGYSGSDPDPRAHP